MPSLLNQPQGIAKCDTFKITICDLKILKSQIVTSSWGEDEENGYCIVKCKVCL